MADFTANTSSRPGQPRVMMCYAHLSPQAMLEAVNVIGNVVERRPVAANQGKEAVATA